MKRWSAGLLAVGLFACEAGPYVPPTVDVPGMPNPEAALQDSMSHVSTQMAQLGIPTPASAHGPVLPAELTRKVYFRFKGTLDAAIRELAGSVGYAVRIEAPAQGKVLTVAVEAEGLEVIDIFRKLGEQMGSRATVAVDPLHHEVSVIHHV